MSRKYNLTKSDNRGKHLPHLKGKDHPRWVGDDITYSGVHKWIPNNYGKPNFCEVCGSEDAKYYEWANLSGNYKRDREDWLRMCASCHKKFDYKDKIGHAHKIIQQFDIKGNFIKEYLSLTLAAKEIGIAISSLSQHLSGRSKTSGGFVWRFK